MVAPPVFDAAVGLWLRPDSGDYLIAAEYLTGAWSELSPKASDVVLDLGGCGVRCEVFSLYWGAGFLL